MARKKHIFEGESYNITVVILGFLALIFFGLGCVVPFNFGFEDFTKDWMVQRIVFFTLSASMVVIMALIPHPKK